MNWTTKRGAKEAAICLNTALQHSRHHHFKAATAPRKELIHAIRKGDYRITCDYCALCQFHNISCEGQEGCMRCPLGYKSLFGVYRCHIIIIVAIADLLALEDNLKHRVFTRGRTDLIAKFQTTERYVVRMLDGMIL